MEKKDHQARNLWAPPAANVKHRLVVGTDPQYWSANNHPRRGAQLQAKPARTACLPTYRHACAAVHKLFCVTTAFEWINSDKRCLNIVPGLCFDSCRLYCLPPGLSFNYIRLRQCLICHPCLIAERDKFSQGLNRFSLPRCHDTVFATLHLNPYRQSVIMVRKIMVCLRVEQWFRELPCALCDVQQLRHF